MRGNITALPSGSWRLAVYVGRDRDSRKRYVRRTVRGDRADAELALAQLLVEVGRGDHHHNRGDGRYTFGQLLDRWLTTVAKHRLGENTWVDYRRQARLHLTPTLGAILLHKLSAADLDATYTAMIDAGYAPATVRRVHQVAHGALEQAVRWRWIAHNAAADTTPPRIVEKEITPPTMAVVRDALAAAETYDPMFGAWIRLAADIGSRRGELAGLRWADIDLGAATVTIRRALAQGDGRIYEKAPKNGRARTVALGRHTVRILEKHRAVAAERALAVGVRLPGDAYVFSPDVASRTPYRPDGMTERWAKSVRPKVVGADHVRLHDLRHVAATQMLAGGVDPKTAAARLGHDPVMLLRRYSHFLPAKDREAADLMDRLLDGR